MVEPIEHESRTARPAGASPGKGMLLVISGPSGVGKTTIVHRLLERFDGIFSVSATTRPRSAKEVDGVDYHFLDEPTFQRWIDEDRFLEHAQVFGRSWYGTPRGPIDEAIAAGRLAVLDIDVQGAVQVRKAMPDAFGIFILPPDEDTLLARLRGRGREDEATIERRFAEARHEIATSRTCGAYDAFVVNDDLDRTVEEVGRLVARQRR
jgi:guanylate kinase